MQLAGQEERRGSCMQRLRSGLGEHISANAQKRMEMQEKCGCQSWTRDSDTK